MCGFLLITNFSNLEKKKISYSLKRISHRGPDDFKEEYDEKNGIYFGFNRLSIQDTSNLSMQPFTISQNNKRYVLLFNGEIYNYKELRKELEILGIKFRSQGDTEVLLQCYINCGLDITLEKIKGMYSFVIFDEYLKKIYVIRDKLGIKNVYYYYKNNQIIFASEIKSILPLIDTVSFDRQAVLLPMFTTYNNIGRTIFKDINELKPGERLEFCLNKKDYRVNEYFNLNNYVNEVEYNSIKKLSDKDYLDKLQFYFENSIQNHLISSTPVGTCFSSGLDSSTVSYASSKYTEDKIKAFFFSSKASQSFNDSYYSSLVSKDLDLDICNEDNINFLNDLPRLLYHYEQPNKPEGIVLSHITKKAKELGFKALLVGDGADELFGGYDYHVDFYKKSKNFNSPYNIIFKILNKVYPFGLYDTSRYDPISTDYFNYPSHPSLFEIPFNLVFHSQSRLKDWRINLENYSFIKNKTERNCQSYLIDSLRYQLPRYLHRSDRYGMMNSVELRTPFLDEDLIKFILNSPLSKKISYNMFKNKIDRKISVKKLAKRIGVPKKIIERKKIGTDFKYFEILRKICKNSNFAHTSEILNIKSEVIKENLNTSLDVHADRAMYGILSIEILGNIFIDNQDYQQIKL